MKKLKLHDIRATANPSFDTMTREIGTYRDIVAAHLLVDGGGDLASITPNRKGSWYARFVFHEQRFTYLLKQRSSNVRDLALQITHERLWRITSQIDRASMEVCDE